MQETETHESQFSKNIDEGLGVDRGREVGGGGAGQGRATGKKVRQL